MPSPTDRNLTAPINPPRAHSMRTSQYVIVALALCITAACGDDNRGPTLPTAPTALTSTSFALSGRITDAETGSAIRYATVLILDGPHAGNTSTSAADGSYSITDVAGNMNISVRAAGYQEAREGLAVLSATQRDFQLTPLTAVAPATGRVHVLYAAPTDREFRRDYSQGIQNALVDFQFWLRQELEGRTFSLYGITPEQCRLSENADFYSRGHAWDKVVRGVQHCAPVREDTSVFAWVIYVDVDEACGEPHELGAGGPGLTILPRGDLEGLANPGPYTYCDEGPYDGPIGRWIGGLGHELGHAFGLPHPPGCDEGSPTCDRDALMSQGYTRYPNTYLRDDEKVILLASPFIGR